MEKIISKEDALELVSGTHLVGKLVGYTYNQLVKVLGEPTFNEVSSDSKVQKEWVIKDGNDVFTIYDWKTYDEQYTMNELSIWNIGGKSYAGDFIYKLEYMLTSKKSLV